MMGMFTVVVAFAQFAADFQAVHFRHHHVEQNDVRRKIAPPFPAPEGRPPPRSRRNPSSNSDLQKPPHVRLVLGDEHDRAVCRTVRRAGPFRAAPPPPGKIPRADINSPAIPRTPPRRFLRTMARPFRFSAAQLGFLIRQAHGESRAFAFLAFHRDRRRASFRRVPLRAPDRCRRPGIFAWTNCRPARNGRRRTADFFPRCPRPCR